MKGEPTILVMCDVCNEDFDFGLTALAGGGWDDRNLEPRLLRDGWLVEDDRHVCPDCRSEARDAS